MFFSAATFYVMASVVSMLRLRTRSPASGQVVDQIQEGFRYVRAHSVFSMVMLLTFCNSLFGMAYIHLMPSFVKEVLGVGPGKVGFLLGAAGVGAIVGTMIIANLKDHHRKGMVILGGAIIYGVGLILFSVAAWRGLYGVSMGLLFLVGVCNSLYLVGGMSHSTAACARPSAGAGHGDVHHDLELSAIGYGPGRIRCPVLWRIGRSRDWRRSHCRGGGAGLGQQLRSPLLARQSP